MSVELVRLIMNWSIFSATWLIYSCFDALSSLGVESDRLPVPPPFPPRFPRFFRKRLHVDIKDWRNVKRQKLGKQQPPHHSQP